MNNILFYLILVALINYIYAKVMVISVSNSLNHATVLTTVINEKENNGHKFINSEVLNNETYLYFRIEEQSIKIFYISFMTIVAIYVIYIQILTWKL